MTAIVLGFATAPELLERGGSVPAPVLGRQLARLVVQGLNGRGDRGVRFLPYLAHVDGRRSFLDPGEALPVDVLCQLHGRALAGATLLVDALMMPSGLLLRWIDPAARELVGERELDFEPERPLELVRDAVAALAEVLGLPALEPDLPPLHGPALAHYLLGLDAQLALDARLLVADPEAAVEHARAALELAPAAARHTAALLIDAARTVLRQGLAGPRTADALLALRASGDAAAVRAGGRLLLASGDDRRAAELLARLVEVDPVDADAVVELSAAWFRLGRGAEALRVLRAAVAAGCRDLRVRAQLAACEEAAGELARRDALMPELVAETGAGAPPSVARIVASWQIDRGRFEAALTLVERALERHPSQVGLWLERGRALLGLLRADDACASLAHCLALGPSVEARDEARRLLRLGRRAGFLPELTRTEALLAAGDLRGAERSARRLVRGHADVAEGWLILGVAALRRGRARRAIRALREALRLEPGLADAHNRLGVLLASRRRLQEGYVHLRRAVELAPGEASAWLHLAQVAQRLGHVVDARAALRRAEELGGEREARLAAAIRATLGVA
ncbi:MAG: tetratricopeptide repeat protein [Planctomycetes bacterium]|nr:tetratricopeptide repeat protein [Planctomycetota bacterium]